MSAPARVAFLGTPEVAVPSLEAIVAAPDLDVVLVVTNPDRPRGRHGRAEPTAVALAAERFGLRCERPEGRADLAAVLRDAAPDVVAVVAYGTLLDAAVLDASGAGAINLHFSVLPRWRGAAPVQAAIRAGDRMTGVTAFRIDAGMDTGPVLARLEVPIGPSESSGELLVRLAERGAPVLLEGLRAALAGDPGEPQPEEGVTLAPRLGPADLVVDLAADARAVAAQVRSLAPRPGAVTTLRGTALKVLVAVPVGADVIDGVVPGGAARDTVALGTVAPGTIVALDPEGPRVACGHGAVRLERVRPAGRATMSGRDLVNGLRLAVGERLGGAEDAPA